MQFIHFGVAAFKELDKQVTFLVAGLDAFENSCNVVVKMIWDVVVQGQNWLLPVVEQLVEFRSLHALFGVGYECACQELTHLLFDGSFAALDILWIDIEISFELVLLFTVSLRLLKMVGIWVSTVKHKYYCHCQGEEVVTHFLFPAGFLFV